jgi:predicted Ser/Thr protein kinase
MSSSSDETSLAETGVPRKTSSSGRPGWLTSSGAEEPGRIPMGTILADRYRVIGLLGRGGMGEVYRADDLRLGQPVALKFLPAAVSDDASRLAQFHNEVRIARQVSHRNVCRVYDIGEADGRIFLTMEYVDGEDLATLLRRIGRLPQDKGIEVARQICAGLAAAHEQGVLHRDLKPANVMLDGQGRVRVTDFGLAGVASEIEDVRSGTPAYMAPEQLAGREVSIKSDLFALGLVLYEIFTGKRAFDAKNVAELLRMHDEGVHLTPTSAVRDLDPAIERVIQRCLEREPARRPASAIAVSAALPGGDPLAAALAAGETPSPEMVAAAGRSEAIPVAQALGLVSAVIVLLVTTVVSLSRDSFLQMLPVVKPPAVLEDRAREALGRLGYREPPADWTSDFTPFGSYQSWVIRTQTGRDRWRDVATGRVPVAGYWLRTSPRPIVPNGPNPRPSTSDPPLEFTGMTLVYLDVAGRLVEFHAVPAERETNPPSPSAVPAPPDWRVVFDLVDWPADRFTPAVPQWTPRGVADARAAWTGTLPELRDTPLRLEAAAFRGRIIFVETIGPWTRAGRMEVAPVDPVRRTFTIFSGILVFAVIVAAAVLARRNMALGRGDRAGANRVAFVLFTSSVAGYAITAHHVTDLGRELDRFFQACGSGMVSAAIFWLAYLALEPWVRRHQPASLISWTRLLTRGVRDPLVGRDLMIGIAFGIVLALFANLARLVPEMVGSSALSPGFFQVFLLRGPTAVFDNLLERVTVACLNTMLLLLLYVGLRKLLRHRVLAAAGLGLVFMAVLGADSDLATNEAWFAVPYAAIVAFLVLFPLLRFGLLPFMAATFANQALGINPMTTSLSAWYAFPTLIVVGCLLAVTAYAFVQSRAGERLLGGKMLPD